MKKATILITLVFGLLLTGCTISLATDKPLDKNTESPVDASKTNIESITDTSKINVESLVDTSKTAAVNLSENPGYCETASDCVAIPNPSNHCYFAAFNKNAFEAIEKFKNNSQMMPMDCPEFQKVSCDKNKCLSEYR